MTFKSLRVEPELALRQSETPKRNKPFWKSAFSAAQSACRVRRVVFVCVFSLPETGVISFCPRVLFFFTLQRSFAAEEKQKGVYICSVRRCVSIRVSAAFEFPFSKLAVVLV